VTAILQRKMTGAKDGGAKGRAPLARVLRGALARAADESCGLALMVTGFEQVHLGDGDLEAALDGPAMRVVLDGSGGRRGAALLSPAMVAAIVRQQTMGRVGDGVPPDRDFTATDAALAAPLIDGALRMAAGGLDGGRDRDCLAGYSFGALAEDARNLALALRATRFRLITLPVRIVGTALEGEVRFLLPEEDSRPRAETGSSAPGESGPGPNAGAMMSVPAELNAVLARIRMPLDKLAQLGPGDLIPIPRQGLDDTAIVAVTGRTVARARLGQMNGYRAVRLVAGQGPAMLRPQTRNVEFAPAALRRPQMPDPPDDGPTAEMSAEDMAAEITQLAGLTQQDLDEDEISGGPV
jgi:flagellar motor switch protein FliM